MIKYLIVLLMTFSVFACKNSEAVPNENNPNLYGEELSSAAAVDFATLLAEIESKGEVENVKVEATVESVCQAKGCWMNIVSDNSPDQPIFVKFKDYGFFVPKDLAGSKVVIEGKAYSEETSVDELRHYAEDEGKSEEEIAAITEPVKELKFMASGVEVLK